MRGAPRRREAGRTIRGREGEARGRVAALALALFALACGGSPAEPMNDGADSGPVEVPPWACVPGETQSCDCGSELTGLRTCDAEGSAFGECDCSPEAMSQGPPPTSTGTEGSSSSGSGSDTETPATTTGPQETTEGPGSTTSPDPTTSGGGSSSTGGSSGSSG